ncbi:MAG: hypothetical protein DRP46_10655 [Candidatus Zixiibacteriota bacterium]|nr:MAG: hypothetical protein DRP46_10655 [candidate division Zixibacteria bacterium]HDL03611.1 hypothetical protein [candidate division Zixibacteria bacterium]
MKKSLIYILGLVLILGLSAQGKIYSFDYQKMVVLPTDPELFIINKIGDVEIKGAPVSRMTIDAVKHVRAADQDEAEVVAEHIEIKVSQSGRKLTVRTNFRKLKGSSDSFWSRLFGSGEDSFGSVDFVITVPQNCRVNVDNLSGSITVSGVHAPVNVTGTDEEIRLDDIHADAVINSMSSDINLTGITGRVDITTGGSNIEFNSITGAIDIHSTSGLKKGSYISGPVTISQTSGAVEVTYLIGDLQLRSTSGNVSVEQEEGAVSIQTHTGDVDIKTELNSSRDYYVETSTGSINFSVPETSSGNIRIETTSGEINTKLPISINSVSQNKMSGSFGSGGPNITLITETGDIIVEEF